jgi:hypothetical protein
MLEASARTCWHGYHPQGENSFALIAASGTVVEGEWYAQLPSLGECFSKAESTSPGIFF